MDKRKYHAGSENEVIREVLKNGPMTALEVAHTLGQDYYKIRDRLTNMACRGFGIASEGKKGSKKYYLCSTKKAEPKRPHIAPRITIGRGARWYCGY
jgi:predicted ArsR family transcriptional regulator